MNNNFNPLASNVAKINPIKSFNAALDLEWRETAKDMKGIKMGNFTVFYTKIAYWKP